MTNRGNVQEFTPATDSITRYLKRLKMYFAANEIKQELQVPTLLSSIGAATFDRLCDLLVPEEPDTKTFAELSTILIKHFEVPRVLIAERYHFRTRLQEEGETITEYEAALRKLATHCKFEARLEEERLDQIVVGLRKESDKRRLLMEVDLTYKRTIELIQASASAEMNAKRMLTPGTVLHIPQKTTASSSRNLPPRIAFNPPQDQPRDCYRCGGKHKPSECKFKEATCHFCKKLGHIARVCRMKARQTSSAGKKFTNRVDQGNTVSQEQEEPKTLHHVEGKE